jgi:hypothetical protein
VCQKKSKDAASGDGPARNGGAARKPAASPQIVAEQGAANVVLPLPGTGRARNRSRAVRTFAQRGAALRANCQRFRVALLSLQLLVSALRR